MKNDLTCEVVQDLLPSYADGLSSEITEKAVEAHLADCPACSELLEQMRDSAPCPEPTPEVDFLKRAQRQLQARAFLLLLLLAYLVAVVYISLFRGGNYLEHEPSLHLFAPFREAWNAWNWQTWRHIVLNCLLFIPLGLLVPTVLKAFQKWYWMLCAAFGLSFVLESLQQVTGLVQFDANDLLTNTLGGMLGFCAVSLLLSLVKKPIRLRAVLGYAALPLATAAAVGAVFLAYHTQELGNLTLTPVYSNDTSEIIFTAGCELSEASPSAPLYRLSTGSQAEQDAFATAFLSAVGADTEDLEICRYPDESTWYMDRSNGGHFLILRLNSGGFRYEYYGTEDSSDSRLSPEEVAARLDALGIQIPADAECEVDGLSGYLFTCGSDSGFDDLWRLRCDDPEELPREGANIGTLDCAFTWDGTLKYLDSSLFPLQYCREVELLSPAQAYEKLQAGAFSQIYDCLNEWDNPPYEPLPAFDDLDVQTLWVGSVTLEYVPDTKGYYQPVYVFTVVCDRETSEPLNLELYIPALA